MPLSFPGKGLQLIFRISYFIFQKLLFDLRKSLTLFFRVDRIFENPGTGLMFYNLSGIRKSPFFHYHAGIYTCIDTGMYVVSHNHSEFSSARVKNSAFYHYFYVLPIMPEICNFRTRSKIATASDNTVSSITQMTYMGIFHDNRVFYLDRIPYPYMVPY